VEAVEAPPQWNEFRPLFLEDFPYRFAGDFGMMMRRGVGDALVEEPRQHPGFRLGERAG
jgi:hypothetical protein